MGDPPHYPEGRGFYVPTKAAISAAIRVDGSKVDQAALIAKIAASIKERAAPTRPTKYISDQIRALRGRVSWSVKKAIEDENSPAVCAPPRTQTIVDLDIAGILVESAVNDFVARAVMTTAARQQACRDEFLTSWHTLPPDGAEVLVRAGLGIGKSQQALEHAAAFLRNPATAGLADRRVIYVTPDHNLASDIARRFRVIAPEVPVFHYRGAAQPDPNHSDFMDHRIPDEKKTKMCRRSDMVADVMRGRRVG